MMNSPNPNSDFAFLPKPPHSSIQDHKNRRTLSSVSPSLNSSLQKVWAEDYFDAGDYSADFESHGSIKLPPAATLTTRPYSRSITLSAEEDACPARQKRTHQRSLTALLPFRAPRTRTNSTSPQRSPTKEKSREDVDFMPTLTGDRDGTIRVADKSKGGLASWFTGSSAPVSVGIQVGDQESLSPPTMSSRDGSPERPPAKLQKRPTVTTLESSVSYAPTKTPASNTTSTSRFNFFSSPKTPIQKTIQLPQSSLDSDEFLTLDITSALFPSNSPGAQDPFSPAAFKNLLTNAEGLLLKLQTAYKLQTLSLHELSSTHSALTDELDEAETRAQCLRSQLEDMASKVSEQDRTIEELVSQLATEKQARSEEKEARQRSIALMTSSRLEMDALHKRSSCSEHEHEHEDLGISNAEGRRDVHISGRKKWRYSSAGSELSTTESDAESGPESVFSRSRSPTLTTSSATSTMTTESAMPEILQASFARMVAVPHSPSRAYAQAQGTHPLSLNTTQRPMVVERASTFQKILRGMATSSATAISPTSTSMPPSEEQRERERERDVVDDMFSGIGMGDSGCKNCRGRDASVAWDAVGLLRMENRGLKDRVGTLEGAVEGALDLCGGLRV